MMATSQLPPGVYEKGGRYFRDVKHRVREIEREGAKVYEVQIKPREVYLGSGARDAKLIEADRLAAKKAGLDFYHPTWGWLRHGWKRELEARENLGSGVERYPTEYVPVPAATDDIPEAASSSTVEALAEARGEAPETVMPVKGRRGNL